MTAPASIETYLALCPTVDEEIVRDFVSRMDRDYFDRFSAETVARHLRLVAALTPDHPAQAAIADQHDGLYEVLVVAYDYFSEFATICGLLSAFGLDIREGTIYTSSDRPASPSPPSSSYGYHARPRRPAGLTRNKIVDLFLVHPTTGTEFSSSAQAKFVKDLTELIGLLDANKQADARRLVNQRLVETLSRARVPFSGLLDPVHVRVDNSLSPTDTVLSIRSTDTPAFLYAFANALAMRGIDIRKARFENVGGSLDDRFFVRDRLGRKLEDPTEQQALVLTATIIKQFTHSLTWAPDPTKALDAFDQFLDLTVNATKGKAQRQALAFLSDKKTLPRLARLLGASDFLWEDFLRRQHGNLLPLLTDYRKTPLIRPKTALLKELDRLVARAETDAAKKEALNQFKDRELFRIDMTHIVEPTTSLSDFSLALTNLAEAIVDRSLRDCQTRLSKEHGRPRLANGKPCPFAILGMGKFGGRELGYASDIEVLFVYGGVGRTSGKCGIENSEYFERLVHNLLQWIEAKQEGIFHLDVRLRPHGGKGPLATPLDEITRYYSADGQAAPFERQALIKLRSVAGDAVLGKQVEAHRDRYVYGGATWDLATALDLRRQQIKQLVEPGTINVKLSPGGVVDIEYSVQYLQIMHGHQRPALRTPNTLHTLAGLIDGGIVSRQDGENLRKAYLFIRSLIDGLRMVRGHAKDLVLPLPDSDEFIFLARRIGYITDDWHAGARHLQTDIERHMKQTKVFFEKTFGAL